MLILTDPSVVNYALCAPLSVGSDSFLCMFYSQLSLNGHLYEMDCSITQTPGIGPVPAVFSVILL